MMGVVVVVVQRFLVTHLPFHEKITQIISVLGSIGLGALFYLFFAFIIRSPEIGHVKEALRARGAKPKEVPN